MWIKSETIITAHVKPRQYHRARALQIASSLGTRAAASYLRNIGFRIEFALAIYIGGSWVDRLGLWNSRGV